MSWDPVPLPLVVWTQHAGSHVSFTIIPGGYPRCRERLIGVLGDTQAQLFPPLAGRLVHLKHKCHRHVKLPLETSRLFQKHPSLLC